MGVMGTSWDPLHLCSSSCLSTALSGVGSGQLAGEDVIRETPQRLVMWLPFLSALARRGLCREKTTYERGGWDSEPQAGTGFPFCLCERAQGPAPRAYFSELNREGSHLFPMSIYHVSISYFES